MADQEGDSGSLLEHYRRLVALRREMEGPLELVPSHEDVLAYARGRHLIAINTSSEPRPAPAEAGGMIDPHAGEVLVRR